MLGDYTVLRATDLAIVAHNLTHNYFIGEPGYDLAGGQPKSTTFDADNAGWNVDSGSGGLLNLPAGRDFAKVFGDRPQLPKPPAERRADASDVPSAARHAQPAVMPNTVKLPKTATDAEIRMITGSILLMLRVLLSLYNRRRAFAR